jgi:Nucleoside-diphosphate-sugar epimerases
MISKKIFYNKKILVTGHTGFKGSWLTEWLKQLGAKVTGISLKPPTKPSHFISSKIGSKIKDLRIDIRNKKILEKKIIEFQPRFRFSFSRTTFGWLII